VGLFDNSYDQTNHLYSNDFIATDPSTELLVLNGVVVSPLEMVYDPTFYDRKTGEDEEDDDNENDEEIIAAKDVETEVETEATETCIA